MHPLGRRRPGPGPDDNTLGPVEPRDRRVRQLEMLLHELGRRERKPLREADVLENVRVEDLEEPEGCVSSVLNVVTYTTTIIILRSLSQANKTYQRSPG